MTGEKARGAAKASLGERVTEQLREDIIRGRFAPGERLTEVRLSGIYGASRVPVREALRALESEGFVVATTFSDRVVAEMTPQDVQDLYELREAVELLTVTRAASRSDPSGRQQLVGLLSVGMGLVAVGDTDGLARLTSRFHAAIAQASGSPVLASMFHQLESKIRWSTAQADVRWRDSWEEHSAIVQAIIAGDAERARQLMSTHLHELKVAAAR